MARIQEEMTKKGRFLRPSELNGRPLRAVDLSHNLFGTTIRMWATFSFFFIIIATIVFYTFFSQYLDKMYFLR